MITIVLLSTNLPSIVTHYFSSNKKILLRTSAMSSKTGFDLTKYNKINGRTINIINGYIRKNQALFPRHITFYTIPFLVNQICAIFYFIPNDKWNTSFIDERFEFHGDTVKILDKGYNHIYLTNIVEFGTHHWKFKLSRYHPVHFSYRIGIFKVKEGQQKYFDQVVGQINTVYAMNLERCSINIHDHTDEWEQHETMKAKQGDIVDMYLNLETLQLQFVLNGEKCHDSITVDKCKYVGVAHMYETGDCIQLLTYDDEKSIF